MVLLVMVFTTTPPRLSGCCRFWLCLCSHFFVVDIAVQPGDKLPKPMWRRDVRIFNVCASFRRIVYWVVFIFVWTSVSPAIVYFPQGYVYPFSTRHDFEPDIYCRTYLISTPIIPYYYTQLIGDAKVPPTLLAAPTFDGFAVIGMPWFRMNFVTNVNVQWFWDANPYIGWGQYFQATNNLWALSFPPTGNLCNSVL